MKQTCSGAGKTVRLTALPSSLITCPLCGRPNLGAVNVRWSVDHFDDVGDVPPHTAAKPSIAEAMAAHKANAMAMRSDDDRYQDALRQWYDSREWLR